jgi:hypothetical protein
MADRRFDSFSLLLWRLTPVVQFIRFSCWCHISESRGLPRSHFVVLYRTSSYLQNFLLVKHTLPVPMALLWFFVVPLYRIIAPVHSCTSRRVSSLVTSADAPQVKLCTLHTDGHLTLSVVSRSMLPWTSILISSWLIVSSVQCCVPLL